jgi:hypothetical protein
VKEKIDKTDTDSLMDIWNKGVDNELELKDEVETAYWRWLEIYKPRDSAIKATRDAFYTAWAICYTTIMEMQKKRD